MGENMLLKMNLLRKKTKNSTKKYKKVMMRYQSKLENIYNEQRKGRKIKNKVILIKEKIDFSSINYQISKLFVKRIQNNIKTYYDKRNCFINNSVYRQK